MSPFGAETPRFTVPPNPWRPERLTVLLVEEPAVKETLGAVTLKSVIVIGTLTEWEIGPLVAVKVSL